MIENNFDVSKFDSKSEVNVGTIEIVYFNAEPVAEKDIEASSIDKKVKSSIEVNFICERNKNENQTRSR